MISINGIGQVLEIGRGEDFNRDNDDSIDIDELFEAWELMAIEGAEDDEDDQPLGGASATSYCGNGTPHLHQPGMHRCAVSHQGGSSAHVVAESVAHEQAS